MKKNNIKISSWILVLAMSAVSVSCVKQDGESPSKFPIDSGEVFDFSVTKSYMLDIDFKVPDGYRVGFDVYTEQPFAASAENGYKRLNNIKPIDKGFTNDKGKYNHPIVLPSYVRKIYIHTQDVGVNPRFFVATIENGAITEALPALISTGEVLPITKSAQTRAIISENTKVGADAMKFQKTHLLLSPWYQGTSSSGSGLYTTLQDGSGQVRLLGRPSEMSYANYSKFGTESAPNNALNISAEVWDKIRTALPGDNNGPVKEQFLADGNIHVSKEDAQLDLIFMDQQALYNNTLAYYCYPTNQPPQSADQIKYPVVAIANGMVQKWSSLASLGDAASLYKGEGVKLKYVDENGQMHDKFPAGTSVGWILYRNGYSASDITFTNGIMAYTINEGYGANYSSKALTANGKSNTAVLRVGDFVVLGFDDGDQNNVNRDYLDLVFHVKATPSSSIIDPVPDVDPEEPIKYIEKSGTIAFEDLWPSQGDFDMNDVVVTYNSKIAINKNNDITETEDSFSLYWCGAFYNNSFSYTLDGVTPSNANVTFEGNITADTKVDPSFSDLTINLFEDISHAQASGAIKPTIKVKTKFNVPINKDIFPNAPYNSYIRINDAKGSVGKETHLTNMKPINPAVANWFGKSDDKSSPDQKLYFITFLKNDNNQQLPFAIHILNTGNSEIDKPYVISREGTRIDNYYPKFINWINTKGVEDADWYLYPINK